MLRRLQHDTVLASCWERWQVCGDVLRGQRNDLLPADFAQRVAQGLAGGTGGALRDGPGRAATPRMLRWGGGAAVAASVALLAVFATRQLPAPDELPEPAPRVAEVAAPAAASAGRQPALHERTQSDPAAVVTVQRPVGANERLLSEVLGVVRSRQPAQPGVDIAAHRRDEIRESRVEVSGQSAA